MTKVIEKKWIKEGKWKRIELFLQQFKTLLLNKAFYAFFTVCSWHF